MTDSIYRHDSGEVPGLLPHLVAVLRPGWRFDAGSFVDDDGQRLDPTPWLIAGARIEPMYPEFQERAPVSEAERDLTRYFQVVFPAGTLVDDHLSALRELPFFDDVRKPPQISLPESLEPPL